MDLAPHEHDALHRLARYGAMPLGQGRDEVPTSAAIRLAMGGFATITDRNGAQHVELTRQGQAFRHRVVA